MAATTKAIAESKTTDRIKIELPITEGKESDVTVIVNGVCYKIQRGEEVEVPKAVYNVLKRSMSMDKLALKRRRARAEQ